MNHAKLLSESKNKSREREMSRTLNMSSDVCCLRLCALHEFHCCYDELCADDVSRRRWWSVSAWQTFPSSLWWVLRLYSDIKDGGRSLKQTAVISYVNVVFWSETEEAERDPDSLRPGWRGVSAVQRKHLRPGSEQLGVSTRARFTAARFTEKVWVTDCLLQYQLQPRDGAWAFLMVSYSSVLCQVHVFLFFVSFL